MPQFDGLPQRRVSSAPRDEENDPREEPATYGHPGTLAKGIVWADILAAIAADEEARKLRDLPDAA